MTKELCTICHNLDDKYNHHLSYIEDITIVVCSGCHSKIHFGCPEYRKYYPIDLRENPGGGFPENYVCKCGWRRSRLNRLCPFCSHENPRYYKLESYEERKVIL